MKPFQLTRIALCTLTASMLVLGVGACATTNETLSNEGNSSAEGAEPSTDSSSESAGLSCDWDSARLLVADYELPVGQTGALDEVLPGNWQFTHYDLGLGGGWESWKDDNDRRYVFAESADLVHCVILNSDVSPSELTATYAVAGDKITLDNGNELTAIAWTRDTLLLSNHQDDSLNLFHRR